MKSVKLNLVYEESFAQLQHAVKTNIDLMNTIIDSLSHFKTSTDDIQAELNKKYKSLPKEINIKVGKSIFKRKKEDGKGYETRLKEIMDAMFLSIIDPDNVSFFVKKLDDIFLNKFTEIKNLYVKGSQRMTANYEKSIEAIKQKHYAYEIAREQYSTAFNKAVDAYNQFKSDRTPETKEQFLLIKQTFLDCQKALEYNLDILNQARLTFNEEYNVTLAIWEEAEIERQNSVNVLLKEFSQVLQTLAQLNKSCALQMKQIEKIYDFEADHPQFNSPLFTRQSDELTYVDFSAPDMPIDITEFIPITEYFSDELEKYEDHIIQDFEGDIFLPAGTLVTVHAIYNGVADCSVIDTDEPALVPIKYLSGEKSNQRKLVRITKDYKTGGVKLKEGTIVCAVHYDESDVLCITANNVKARVPLNIIGDAYVQ